jgi:hypothetical protein
MKMKKTMLVVWNMDPFVIEEGNATPVQGEYRALQSSTMGTPRRLKTMLPPLNPVPFR